MKKIRPIDITIAAPALLTAIAAARSAARTMLRAGRGGSGVETAAGKLVAAS